MSVNEHECYMMTQLRERGEPVEMIALTYGVSEGTVYTHTNGKCNH